MNSKITLGHALLIELLITFELVFTVFATCDSKRTDLSGSASLAIGFAVAIGHLFAVSSLYNRGVWSLWSTILLVLDISLL